MTKKLFFSIFTMLLFFATIVFAKSFSAAELLYSKNDTLSIADTLKADSSTVANVKQKLIPINIKSVSADIKNTLSAGKFKRTDYRYSGNIFTNFPFVFEQDLGSLGQPNHFNIYGYELSNISVNRDGININNRWKNTTNFYDIQSELIDSVEILPPSQSFFYSINNSPVLINIINNEKNEKRPTSKLRFYQAPNEEGFVSVYLNTYALSRLMLSAEVSNMSINSRNEGYNNDFSNWQTFLRLKYFYSNELNLSAHYYYSKNQTGLNGGAVNNSLINDDLQAVSVYPNRFLRNNVSQFDFNIYAKLIDENESELNIYAQNELQEFKQDKKQVNDKIPTIVHENSYKTIGLRFFQPIEFHDTYFELLANYEKVTINNKLILGNAKLYQSGIAVKAKHSFGIITPSVFAKVSNSDGENYYGFGSGMKLKITNGLNVSAGLSNYSKPVSLLQQKSITNGTEQKITAFDLSIDFGNNFMNSRVSYFLWNNDNYLFPVLNNSSDSIIVNETGFYSSQKITTSGINIFAESGFWKIKTSINFNYYLSKSNADFLSSPRMHGMFGLYYINKLFESNLDLKAGINCSYFSDKSFAAIDFERTDLIYFQLNGDGKRFPIDGRFNNSKFIFDLFISGIIQKRANVFIVMENLLDTKYYIMPYYLMPQRSLRLGVDWKFID